MTTPTDTRPHILIDRLVGSGVPVHQAMALALAINFALVSPNFGIFPGDREALDKLLDTLTK